MKLKTIFDQWAHAVPSQFTRKQWLLSKWETSTGIEWPPSKINAMLRSIKHRLQLTRVDRMIELGCGGGWILSALRKDVAKSLGLDFSWEMLRHARANIPSKYLLCAEIGRLPFKSESFSRVLSYFVFINLTDVRYVERSILEIVRILKKGGRALIGQIPLKDGSKDYDRAKESYLRYCQKAFPITKSIRDIHAPPIELFERTKLEHFLKAQKIRYQIYRSFNPFFRPGQPLSVDWRIDLVLEK